MSKKTLSGKFHFKPISIWTSPKRAVFFYAFNLVFLCTITCLAQAQDYTSTNTKALKAYENATTAFDGRSLELALAYLDEAIDRDPDFIEAYLMRFEVYAEQDDLVKAEFALEDALAINPDFYRNAWFFLAEIEMITGRYIEAEPHYKKFLAYQNLNPEMVAKANLEIANCKFAIVAKQEPVDFVPVNLGEAINSPMPEYYPSISTDGSSLIYTRLIEDNRAFGGKQEDFFQSTNRDGTWFPAFPISSINTEFNEGAASISADGKYMVFTGCEGVDGYGAGRIGFGSCDLFISENIGGKWQKPVNIGEPINSRYWETQPSLSADGNTLYFVRGVPTRARGVKNQDIYSTRKKADGKWTRPQKLSEVINTPFKEESVQIHPDGKTLYFSSAGHPGMGGLDLFVSRKGPRGAWEKPVNLGYPINTYGDENSILISAEGDLAFFASNRDGGLGDLDIYQFPLYEAARPIPVTYAMGRVRDAETTEPVVAQVKLTDVNNRTYKKTFTSDAVTGQFLLTLNKGDQYAATVTADGYLFHSETFTVGEKSDFSNYALDVDLHKIKEGSSVVLKNIFFDTDKDSLTQYSIPELRQLGAFLEANPDVIIEISGHTDNTGSAEHNADLSQRRADAVKTYIVLRREVNAANIKTKGYGSDMPIASNDTEAGRAKNRRTEIKIVGNP